MEQLNEIQEANYLKAEKSLLQAFKFYKKNLLIKVLLVLPFALVCVATFLAVYQSQLAYLALILIAAIIAIAHIYYIVLAINPAIQRSAHFLDQYKSQMAKFYESKKLNWFNRIIFKDFFLVEMYGLFEPKSILKYPEQYEISKHNSNEEITYDNEKNELESNEENFESEVK
ncbi:hypothetical protein ACNQ1U_02295 [Mycoplasma sp. 653B]|uniref:hypothetical protein n=1 Tax=Mycoplasma sp. 653B TaxID=3401677 RepID=UPI003AAC611D